MKTLKITAFALIVTGGAALAIAAVAPKTPADTATTPTPSAIVSEAVSGQDHVHGTKPEGSTRATKTGCDMAGLAGHKTAKKGDHAMGCGMGGTAKKMSCCN